MSLLARFIRTNKEANFGALKIFCSAARSSACHKIAYEDANFEVPQNHKKKQIYFD